MELGRWLAPDDFAGTPGPVSAPAAAPSGPTCGRVLANGCYTTYKRIVDADGQPQLVCVQECGDDQGQGQQ